MPHVTAKPDGRRSNGRTPKGLPAEVRFWAKVEGTQYSYCWLWQAAVDDQGYGRFFLPGPVLVYAHRWAYEHLVGAVPDGLQLDHLCRNRSCVNPWHLDPVTPLVNTKRGYGNGRKHVCPQGHPYDEENTYVWNGRRKCRTCGRESTKRWHQQQKTAA